ncbi:Protein-tyrosine-phosphatase MKP1, partial [Cucurbita argyrosperma subsp. sororia]
MDEKRVAGCTRNAFFRSVSWSERSPSKPRDNRSLVSNSNKARFCVLPPLQPLSISRRSVEEWPPAGCDDLGVWPNPETPREVVDDKAVREFEFKKDKLAYFDKKCSKILDHVYLGSDSVAKNREVLRQNGITHVLNCVGFVCPEYFKGEFVYKLFGCKILLQRILLAFSMMYLITLKMFVSSVVGFSCIVFKECLVDFSCNSCQKRVHALPASPDSTLRMYRMAPHSSYDPLHLVPKMLNTPTVQGLDSRGAFVMHVPSAIYVWEGEKCNSVMLNSAKAAALQIIRYEKARGPILSIKKVEEYNPDFEIFHRAISDGVVPPFDISNTDSENYLPVRENGWETIKSKIENKTTEDIVTSFSELDCDTKGAFDDMDMMTANIDEDPNAPVSSIDLASPPLSPTAYLCDSPESFDCFPARRLDREIEDSKVSSIPDDPLSIPIHPLGSPDSFSSFQGGTSPKFGTKSPSLSPSTSDNSSSFTFSPSSSNWSDLSYMSSQQPSPSDVIQYIQLTGNTNLTSRGASPSIAERRGSHPPPGMLLPSIEEACKVQRKIVSVIIVFFAHLRRRCIGDSRVQPIQ